MTAKRKKFSTHLTKVGSSGLIIFMSALEDKVDIEAEVEQLVVTLGHEPMTLEDLLAKSSKESFKALDEDQDWIDAKSVGREI